MSNHTRFGTWLILLSLLWMWGCGSSKQANTPYQDELPNTILWRIDSKDLSAPSYLLGTIHIIPEHLYFWPDEFREAFESTSQVVLETNELGMDPSEMMSILPKIMLPDGQSLEDLTTEEEYNTIDQYFSQMGLPVMLFNNVKPFFLYILVDVDMSSLMQDNIKSYEMEITAMAKEVQKPILGLETLDFQLSLFDSISYEDQADLLVDAIEQNMAREESGEESSMDELYKTYVDQNLNSILEEIKSSDPGFTNFSRILLENRNIAWLPKIEEIIRQTPSFIAVGAAHLPGESGVIHLLQKAGYTLTPILNKSNGTD